MTKPTEAYAIIPGTHAALPLKDTHIIASQGYSVLLAHTPGRARILPQTRRQALTAAADRMRHLEAAMPFGPVIPFQPGTQLAPGDAAPLIAANRPLLDDLAVALTGRVQYQVSVSWLAHQVLDRFRDTPELRPLFARRRTDATQLQQAVGTLAKRIATDIAALIATPSIESIQLPCTDDLLMNMVVLLPEAEQATLDTALEAVDALWPEGLRIRQIGPAPAASFATLAVTPIKAQDLTAACAILGIQPRASLDDIRAARTAKLRRSPHLASAITAAAARASAYARAGQTPFGFCDVVREGTSNTRTTLRGAA